MAIEFGDDTKAVMELISKHLVRGNGTKLTRWKLQMDILRTLVRHGLIHGKEAREMALAIVGALEHPDG
jgi:hypothetical protein